MTAPFEEQGSQLNRDRSWERICTKIYRNSPIKSKKGGGRINFLELNKFAVSASASKVDRDLNRMCCCHTSPRNRSRLEVVNEYSQSVKKLRSPKNLSFRSRTAIDVSHTQSVVDLMTTSRMSI